MAEHSGTRPSAWRGVDTQLGHCAVGGTGRAFGSLTLQKLGGRRPRAATRPCPRGGRPGYFLRSRIAGRCPDPAEARSPAREIHGRRGGRQRWSRRRPARGSPCVARSPPPSVRRATDDRRHLTAIGSGPPTVQRRFELCPHPPADTGTGRRRRRYEGPLRERGHDVGRAGQEGQWYSAQTPAGLGRTAIGVRSRRFQPEPDNMRRRHGHDPADAASHVRPEDEGQLSSL